MAQDLDYVPMPDNIVGAIKKSWSAQIKDKDSSRCQRRPIKGALEKAPPYLRAGVGCLGRRCSKESLQSGCDKSHGQRDRTARAYKNADSAATDPSRQNSL